MPPPGVGPRLSDPGGIVPRVLEERDPARGGIEPSPNPPGWSYEGPLGGPDERPVVAETPGVARRRAPSPPARAGDSGRRPRVSESGRLPFPEELGLSSGEDLPRLAELSDASFEREVLQSPLPVVVDFWADTCVPCRLQEPALQRLARDLAGRVKIARLNVFEHPRAPERLRIKGVPHLIAFVNGEVVLELVGGHSYEQLREKLRAAGLA